MNFFEFIIALAVIVAAFLLGLVYISGKYGLVKDEPKPKRRTTMTRKETKKLVEAIDNLKTKSK